LETYPAQLHSVSGIVGAVRIDNDVFAGTVLVQRELEKAALAVN
jgi:hypothetical protein